MVARGAWDGWADESALVDVDGARLSHSAVTIRLLEGKEFFDAYRAAEARTTTRFVEHRDAALTQQRAALVAVLVAYLGATGVAAARTVVRRRRLRRTLLAPIAEVLGTIGSLRSGDLTARASATGVE